MQLQQFQFFDITLISNAAITSACVEYIQINIPAKPVLDRAVPRSSHLQSRFYNAIRENCRVMIPASV